MSTKNVTKLSIGQDSSTVIDHAKKGTYFPLADTDPNSLVCKNSAGEIVAPKYLDAWNPLKQKFQPVTIHDNSATPICYYQGTLFQPLVDREGYSHDRHVVLVSEGSTKVFQENRVIIYHTMAKPSSIEVEDESGLSVSYNTRAITWRPFYKIFVNRDRITRLELWADIKNNTGMIIRPTPSERSLEFKVTDPHCMRGRLVPCSGGGTPSAGAKFTANSVEELTNQVTENTLGEGELYIVPAQDISPDRSTIVLRMIRFPVHEKLFWYDLGSKNMHWGFRINTETFYPGGQAYVIDEETRNTLGDNNAGQGIYVPMTKQGETFDLNLGEPVNQKRYVNVQEVVTDTEKVTVYQTVPDTSGVPRTIYTLGYIRDGTVTPAVSEKNYIREFNAGVVITVTVPRTVTK